MTARHAPPPRHRIAAASVWADNLPQPCKWFTFAAAVALVGGGLAVPFVGGLNTQVQAATDEHLALTVERPAEPSAHGGPLAPMSIGVVAPETDVPVVPPIVRANRPESPVSVPVPTLRVSRTPETPSQAVQGDPVAITDTSEPTVAEPTQAATATATTTAPATTTRTCHRWRCHSWPTTTSATTTAAPTTSETETSDPLAPLSDVIGTEKP